MKCDDLGIYLTVGTRKSAHGISMVTIIVNLMKAEGRTSPRYMCIGERRGLGSLLVRVSLYICKAGLRKICFAGENVVMRTEPSDSI